MFFLTPNYPSSLQAGADIIIGMSSLRFLCHHSCTDTTCSSFTAAVSIYNLRKVKAVFEDSRNIIRRLIIREFLDILSVDSSADSIYCLLSLLCRGC